MKLRQCSEEDSIKADQFLINTFYVDEPLASSLDPADIPPPGKGMASKFLHQGLSVLVEDENGEIIAMAINDKKPQDEPAIYSFTDNDNKFQEMFQYLEEKSNILVVAPDALEVRLMAVSPNFRKMGLATKLVQEATKVARKEGYKWVKIYCTSDYTARLVAKLGWIRLYSESYENLKKLLQFESFPTPPHPHTHVHIYINRIT